MLFWARHANFRRVEMTFMTPPPEKLISFKFYNILDASSELGDAPTQLRDASTQLGDAANFTLKYSSIF